MKTFYWLLSNALIAGVTNNFVWFALVFWVYLETQSVVATSYLAGIYMIMGGLSGFWFGSIVDHHKKKTAMMVSSIVTLLLFSAGFLYFSLTPEGSFHSIQNTELWVLILLLLTGVTVGNIRNIALPTTVTILVEEGKRDRANGLSGSMMGISFSITSFASGLILAYGGIYTVLAVAITLTVLAIVHLIFIQIPEKAIVHVEGQQNKIDIKGTFKVIQSIPGLLALVGFAVINNLFGGVFMSLMDAYGLTLVSVQIWGVLWGIVSMGIILGGFMISKIGLGKNPLRTMFLGNIAMWTISLFFTIQPWILLTAVGIFLWLTLMPFVEASEQTIIQKVVPHERQGRVFGFSQSVEQMASPLVAFFIGPIAQYIFIPFMTTGAGVGLMGGWYGVGEGRGMALVFTLTGLIGLVFTVFAMRSKPYKLLSKTYLR